MIGCLSCIHMGVVGFDKPIEVRSTHEAVQSGRGDCCAIRAKVGMGWGIGVVGAAIR